MNQNIIERYGSLKKNEHLKLITDEAVVENTLAFESPEPFPGYYGSQQGQTIPLYVYLVLDQHLYQDDFLAINEQIKTKFSQNYHATLANLEFFDEEYHAIRIRNVDNYGTIYQLQQMYIDNGIPFRKQTKRYKDIDKAFVRIKKFFKIEEIEPGFFIDRMDAYHGYFIIDQHLKFDDFGEIAKQVAYNVDIIDYDAGLACYFENFSVHDMIRIYTDQISLDILKQIKYEYDKRLSKLHI